MSGVLTSLRELLVVRDRAVRRAALSSDTAVVETGHDGEDEGDDEEEEGEPAHDHGGESLLVTVANRLASSLEHAVDNGLGHRGVEPDLGGLGAADDGGRDRRSEEEDTRNAEHDLVDETEAERKESTALLLPPDELRNELDSSASNFELQSGLMMPPDAHHRDLGTASDMRP